MMINQATEQYQHYMGQLLLAPILESNFLSGSFVGFGVVHLGLVFAGLPTVPCPFLSYLGTPCLGCGVSRGISSLLQGDWRRGLEYHLFAPVFLLAFILMGILLFVPAQIKELVIARVTKWESEYGISSIFILSCVVYWLIRMMFNHDQFVSLLVV